MAATPPTTPQKRSGRSRLVSARTVVPAVLAALATLFAVLNLDEVAVDLVVASPRVPLIIVIAVCVLVGVAIGWVLGRRGRRPR